MLINAVCLFIIIVFFLFFFLQFILFTVLPQIPVYIFLVVFQKMYICVCVFRRLRSGSKCDGQTHDVVAFSHPTGLCAECSRYV